MHNTKLYRINSWTHWSLILTTGFLEGFYKIYFVKDEQNILWLFKEPFRQGEPLICDKEHSRKIIITELGIVEKNDNKSVRIKIRRYINLLSTILIRFEEASFTIDTMSDDDYEILSNYTSNNLRFFNWFTS